MKLKLQNLIISLLLLCSSCDVLNISTPNHPTKKQIEKALKEALQISLRNSIKELGQFNAINKNPYIRIEFPEDFIPVKVTLTPMGAGERFDKLSNGINTCAERSVSDALLLCENEINNLVINNPKKLLFGPDAAITVYFRINCYKSLTSKFQPVVKENLDKMSLVKEWEDLISIYYLVPYYKKVTTDISGYVAQKTIDAIIYDMLGQEAAIRQSSVLWKSKNMIKVFTYRNNKRHNFH